MDGATERLHATSIAVGARAALIIGPSGSGKSDLALRCMAIGQSSIFPAAVHLVSDDQTVLARRGLTLVASPPDEIAGRLEIRGLGIVEVEFAREASVVLAVDIAASSRQPRFPDPWPTFTRLGLAIPLLRLAAFEASAAAKLVSALALADLPDLVETAATTRG